MGDGNDDLHTARAELVLARDDVWPLRDVPLDPDPLTPFAAVFGRLRDDLEEAAEVHVDLVPVPRGKLLGRRRQASKRLAEKHDPTSGGTIQRFVDGLLAGLGHPRDSNHRGGGPTGVARKQLRTEEKILSDALADTTPHFEVQILVRVRSAVEGRPQTHLQGLLGCFDTWAGDNWWKVAGFRIFGKHFGADAPWRRRRFDRRIDQGKFCRRDDNIVAAGDIAGILKPPTANCAAVNVIRTGGVVPPPPRQLPTFDHSDWQMPWGVVQDAGQTRTVATRLNESLFTMSNGRSRYGKTETSLARFIHLARSGHGCLFLDPHADALQRAKPYLVGQADRVIELSIARGSAEGRQIAWNPFSMEGLSAEDTEDKAAAIVDSFAAAMRWSEINNRALSITQMTTQSLLELALQLPDELAPTIFQMASMLSREEWREAALPHLSPSLRDYWTTRFPKLSDEAITPVTNVIDRMRASRSIAALLGSSRSTYDLRQAMDAGQIVLVRLRGESTIDELMASFVIFDLLRAVLSRWDMDPDQRRPMHVFLDEVQSYDHSVRNLLASALEQGGKYGLRVHLLCQQPDRLSNATFQALLTNRSHLASANVRRDSAKLLAKELGSDLAPETIQGLDKYQFISQVTHRGQLTTPFRMRGLHLPDLFQPGDKQEVAELEEAIDVNSGRRPVADILGELADLDEKILQATRGGSELTYLDDHRQPGEGGRYSPGQVRGPGRPAYSHSRGDDDE